MEKNTENFPITANPADIDRLLGMQMAVLLTSGVTLTVGRAGLLTHLATAAQFNRIDLQSSDSSETNND